MPGEGIAVARERLGHVLRDRWLLEEVLGVGGMAAVYAARHRNGARAAIKLLHKQLGEEPDVRERFMREAYLANSVDHPGVVRVLDDDADPELGPFLVMELLQGESVLELLERGVRIDLDHALGIADQALDVLAAAHERGIVHRDLKPANLFVCRSGGVKVLDFGIARLLDDTSRRLTRTGTPIGTPAYMAPEQAGGAGRSGLDARADIYSLGATLFRILANRHVHVGHGAEQIVMVATRRAPRIGTVVKVPAAVAALIDHALEFEPDRRYTGAREMQTDVRLVRAGMPPANAPALTERPEAEPPILRRPVVPTKVEAKETKEIVVLADAERQRAHEIARRPDAFSAPAGNITGDVVAPDGLDGENHQDRDAANRGDEFDDDLPTIAVAQREMPVGRRAAPAFVPPEPPPPLSPSARVRLAAAHGYGGASPSEPPRSPPVDMPPRPQPQNPLTNSGEHEAAAQAWHRVPNVPVPSQPRAPVGARALAATVLEAPRDPATFPLQQPFPLTSPRISPEPEAPPPASPPAVQLSASQPIPVSSHPSGYSYPPNAETKRDQATQVAARRAFIVLSVLFVIMLALAAFAAYAVMRRRHGA